MKKLLIKLLAPPHAHAGLKTACIILLGLAVNIAALFFHAKASSQFRAEKEPVQIPGVENAFVIQQDKTAAGKIAAESDTLNAAQSAEDEFSTNSMEALTNLMDAMIIEKRIPVDLTGITDINEKVSKIFNAFLENARNRKTASFPSPYADQMAELGTAAVPELLKMLEESMKEDPSSEEGMDQDNSNKQMFLAEALGQLLTDQNKEVILQYFDKYGMFGALVAKYKFPESEEIIFNKLAEGYPIQNALFVNYKDERDLIDAALAVDEEQTVALLLEQLRQGIISESALERMAHIHDLDLREPLREAAANNKSAYDRQILLKPMLELGMNEGLDLALALLKSEQKFARDAARDLLTNYTGVLGSAGEMAEWLETHRGELAWNPESHRYELKTEP